MFIKSQALCFNNEGWEYKIIPLSCEKSFSIHTIDHILFQLKSNDVIRDGIYYTKFFIFYIKDNIILKSIKNHHYNFAQTLHHFYLNDFAVFQEILHNINSNRIILKLEDGSFYDTHSNEYFNTFNDMIKG
jgi:hypothetical protein